MLKKISFLIFLLILISISTAQEESAYGKPIKKDLYEISRSKIERQIPSGEIFRDSIAITSLKDSELRVNFFVTESLNEIFELENVGGIVPGANSSEFFFTIKGKELKNYEGQLSISGSVNENIPINITIVNKTDGTKFFVEIEPAQKKFTYKEKLDFKAQLTKTTKDELKNISITYNLIDQQKNKTYFLGNETLNLVGTIEIRHVYDFPQEIKKGFYIIETQSEYLDRKTTSSTTIEVTTPFWQITFFGVLPMWLLAIILFFLLLSIIAFVLIRRAIEKSKKYKMQLYTKTLPKKGERTLWLGKVAETNIESYYEMDAMTTHGVVAGATGGGKSIAAQVLIEEALINNIAVIVFDPTAQWSGMLRKCDDKKMLGFYQKFGMKPEAARAFPGNIKQIKNERQAININKYMNPGQIQVFTMNKLTPPQIDTFVATVIASIFKSDPKEFPNLRVLLVFDEVHRLLPKFGGSGKGFLQIERACREFRKWGFGVLLVSQVLSDFVGEIKANINTEIQMRTRDESDLNRLKTKYGEEFLQSLIKASVGVGMFVNPRYNKGKPYFINFRPILHSTRRLSDAILDQYNSYTETIEELEYQIEQLEAEKVDTFDLKMELKLVKDKLMTGNFSVVDIYLEGLKPRIDKQWQTLGKKPKKLEIELVDTSVIEASLAQAQKGREEFEKANPNAPKQETQKQISVIDKIVAAITLDNGAMISSLAELRDTLPNLDEEVFKFHVNDEKNEIAAWVEKEISPELGAKLKETKEKQAMLTAISEFEKAEKEKNKPKEEAKPEEKKGGS